MRNQPTDSNQTRIPHRNLTRHIEAGMFPPTRRYSPGRLGKLIGMCVFVKTFEVIANLVYYQTYASTGKDSTPLQQLTHVVETLSSGSFLSLLLLFCLGWGITRPDLSRREKRMFWGVCVLYIVFGLLHSICETPSICQVEGPKIAPSPKNAAFPRRSDRLSTRNPRATSCPSGSSSL